MMNDCICTTCEDLYGRQFLINTLSQKFPVTAKLRYFDYYANNMFLICAQNILGDAGK